MKNTGATLTLILAGIFSAVAQEEHPPWCECNKIKHPSPLKPNTEIYYPTVEDILRTIQKRLNEYKRNDQTESYKKLDKLKERLLNKLDSANALTTPEWLQNESWPDIDECTDDEPITHKIYILKPEELALIA